jgi:hypothetical protein
MFASIAAICADLAALFLLLRDAKGEGVLRPVLLAALLSVACVLEPANVAALVVCAAYLFLARPGALARFVLTSVFALGLVVLWSERRLHRPFPLRTIDLEPSTFVYAPFLVCAIAFVLARGHRMARLGIAATSATLWFSALSTHGGILAASPFAAFALYVLLADRASRAKTTAAAALAIALLLAGKSALARKPVVAEVSPEPPRSPRIALGDRSSDPFVVSGFSGPEGTFRWTEAHRAQLRLPKQTLPPEATQLVVAIELTPYLAEGRRTEQRVDVSYAGRAIATWSVKRPEPSVYVARIDRALLGSGEDLLTLDLPDAVSPSTLGIGGDARVLGVAIHSIELRAEGEP